MMTVPWECSPPMKPPAFADVLRRAAFECFKWHTQVEDRTAVCPFALILRPEAWRELARLANALAAETLAAERELLDRPKLHHLLGLPGPVRECLVGGGKSATPGAARVMRFDFHWTTEGWRISEANTDAAGGFIESSGMTALMASSLGHKPAGDPAGVLAAALRRSTTDGAIIGLMHLSVYSEDRQVMLYLARRLEEVGLRHCLHSPEQMRWVGGLAAAECQWHVGPLDRVVRFFPSEWLPRLPRNTRWERIFAGGQTGLCNPGSAVLTQSKRFALAWDRLDTPLPTWRALLPETRAPKKDLDGADWVLKPALGHEGRDIGIAGVIASADWERIRSAASAAPENWAAQRRFDVVPLNTPEGPMYPCVGVYVIDGDVAGVYGRLSHRALTDDRSRDAAVLVRSECPAENRLFDNNGASPGEIR